MTTRGVSRPHFAFAYEVTIQHQHAQIISLGRKRPSAHFHPYQKEYVEVLEGRMGLELDCHDRLLGPEDGQVQIEPWTAHTLPAAATVTTGEHT